MNAPCKQSNQSEFTLQYLGPSNYFYKWQVEKRIFAFFTSFFDQDQTERVRKENKLELPPFRTYKTRRILNWCSLLINRQHINKCKMNMQVKHVSINEMSYPSCWHIKIIIMNIDFLCATFFRLHYTFYFVNPVTWNGNNQNKMCAEILCMKIKLDYETDQWM